MIIFNPRMQLVNFSDKINTAVLSLNLQSHHGIALAKAVAESLTRQGIKRTKLTNIFRSVRVTVGGEVILFSPDSARLPDVCCMGEEPEVTEALGKILTELRTGIDVALKVMSICE